MVSDYEDFEINASLSSTSLAQKSRLGLRRPVKQTIKQLFTECVAMPETEDFQITVSPVCARESVPAKTMKRWSYNPVSSVQSIQIGDTVSELPLNLRQVTNHLIE